MASPVKLVELPLQSRSVARAHFHASCCSLFQKMTHRVYASGFVRASQGALAVKNPLSKGGDLRNHGSIPGSGRCHGGGHGNPLQDSCLENPVDRGAWWATCSPQGLKESDTTERLDLPLVTFLGPYCRREGATGHREVARLPASAPGSLLPGPERQDASGSLTAGPRTSHFHGLSLLICKEENQTRGSLKSL